MKRLAAVVVVLVFTVGLALAHGNEQHIMGKVTHISENSITVETVRKETKTVKFTSETKFVKSGSPASVKDLKVGDGVVIHAEKKGERLEAREVHFGAQSPSKNP